MRLVFLALVTLTALPALAQPQMRDNRDKQLTCNNIRRDGPLSCEIRETTLGPSGRLDIEPSHNGGVTVRGWTQNNVLVRARVETWAENDREARTLASQVHVEAAGGTIRGTGPDLDGFFRSNQDRRWTVSFEIFAPWNTDLRLSSHNGGIDISDMRGQINFESHNGGVDLKRVAGDVRGETHNGGINVELNGNAWEGRELEVNTHNGGITLSLPASYSAHVETSTHHGRVDSDFPITVRGRLNDDDLNFNIGSGGASLKVKTHNGGIRLRKL